MTEAVKALWKVDGIYSETNIEQKETKL